MAEVARMASTMARREIPYDEGRAPGMLARKGIGDLDDKRNETRRPEIRRIVGSKKPIVFGIRRERDGAA